VYTSKPIEDILRQVNHTLAPHERVSADQIRNVGHQLDCLLHEAEGPEYHSEPEPLPELTLKDRLLQFWQQIKEKFAAMMAAISPRWRKLINRLKQILQTVSDKTGEETLLTAALIVIVIAVAAALINSLPLIVALLSVIGFISLVRLLERVTRPGLLLGR